LTTLLATYGELVAGLSLPASIASLTVGLLFLVTIIRGKEVYKRRIYTQQQPWLTAESTWFNKHTACIQVSFVVQGECLKQKTENEEVTYWNFLKYSMP